MWKKIGLWGLGLLTMVLVFVGGSVVAKADGESLDGQVVSGLDAPKQVNMYDASKPGHLGDEIDTKSPMSYKYLSGNYYHLIYQYTFKPGTKITDKSYVTVHLPTQNIDSHVNPITVTKSDTDPTSVGRFTKDEDPTITTGRLTYNATLAGDDVLTTGKLDVIVRGSYINSENTGGGSHNVVDKSGWWPDNNDITADITTGTSVTPVTYPTKTGWNVVFNSDEKNMGDVTLVDTFGPYQTYSPDFLDVTETKDGVAKKIDFSDSQQAEMTLNGSELKFVFKNVTGEMSLQYYATVDYQTLIDQKLLGGHLSNYVELTAEDGETGSSGEVPGSGDDSGVPSVSGKSHNDIPWGNGGGSGTIDGSSFMGSLVFTKQDATDKSKTLKNAVYTLQKKDDAGNFTDFMTFSTDYKGVFSTDSLPMGIYRVQETTAPVGYQLNPAPSKEFKVDITNVIVNVSQNDEPYKVTLTKSDEKDTKKLANAVYRLYYAGTQELASNLTYKTDANGQLTISPIAKGSYDFIEQTPPAGYELDQTPIPFTISDDKQTTPSNDGPNAVVSQEDESSVPTPGTDTGSGSSSSSSSSSSSGSSNLSSSSSSSSSSSTSTSLSTRTSTSTSSSNSADSSSRHGDRVGSTPVPRASSSTHGGGVGTVTGNQASSAKRHGQANGLLPKTNEAKSIFAALGGLLLIGGGLSVWQYRRTRQK